MSVPGHPVPRDWIRWMEKSQIPYKFPWWSLTSSYCYLHSKVRTLFYPGVVGTAISYAQVEESGALNGTYSLFLDAVGMSHDCEKEYRDDPE
jgi:hypothetical protein